MILLHRLVARNFKQLSEVALQFPAQGTILIEGHNEAGKSSLFEAVFFALYGQPLTSDRDYKIEDLRSYNEDILEVELEFSIENRRFSIRRKVGKSHTVKLVCPALNGETETISIRSEASRRIFEELRLTSDALLNTCFVEQKRLERLEDLHAEARRATINELLNLRVLTQLEAEYKVTKEDRDTLDTLRKSVHVARLDAALPDLEKAVHSAQQCLLYARLCEAAARQEQWQQDVAAAAQRQQEIAGERATIAQSLTTATKLQAQLDAVDAELAWRLEAWQETRTTYEQATARIETLQLLQSTLPQRKAKLYQWRELKEKLARLEALEKHGLELQLTQQQQQARLEHYDQVWQDWQKGEVMLQALICQRQNMQTALIQAETQWQEYQAAEQRLSRLALLQQHLKVAEAAGREVQGIETLLAQAQNHAALLPELQSRLVNLEAAERRLRLAEETRHAVQQVEASLTHTARQQLPTQLIASILADVQAQREATQVRIESSPIEDVFASQVLATLDKVTRHAELLRETLVDGEAIEATDRLEQLSQEQQRLQAELQAAADLPQTLQELGVAPDLDSVRGALQALRHKLEDCTTHAAMLDSLTLQHNEKSIQWEQEQQHVTVLLQELALSDKDTAVWLEAATQEHAALQAVLIEQASANLPEQVRQARETLGQIDKEQARLEAEQQSRKAELEKQSRSTLEAELNQSVQQIRANSTEQELLKDVRPVLQQNDLPLTASALQTHLALLEQQWQQDQAAAQELPSVQQVGQQLAETLSNKAREFGQAWQAVLHNEPPEVLSDAAARLQQIRLIITNDLAQLHPATSRARDSELQQQAESLNQIIITRRHQQEEAQNEQVVLCQELGIDAAKPLEYLATRYPEFGQASQHDSPAWERVLHERQEAVRDNRSQRRAEAQALGVGEEPLDLSEAETARNEAEKHIAVKRRASEIVNRTRQSIVSRVMPLTMQNMRQLLPLLTDGRYQDVLWDEENNYLAVYDSRAHAFQRKRVFSGGARDQISLALRLAFALATLPGEHNIRPGWLFLDEPLSSFDRRRTQALVDLLTQGAIRRHFAQIFLVSHSESFEPAQFDYRLRLEGGHIVESTLPEKN
ncbi:MAG: AAA family ATPase [Abitibacteriaceae bacterium]|nr:AAA family ATPase [Abditibacteriaceae bacterium]